MENELVARLSKLNENLDEQSVEQEFRNIAEYLLGNCCIKQKNIEYRFLEVEFYYYSHLHQDVKEKTGQPFVYPRQCNEIGAFFMHSSGLDICFKSEISGDDKFLYGGGILLRSLLRIGPQNESMMVVTGPWDCCDALFNYTFKENFPTIEKKEECDEVDLKSVRRYNDKECSMKRNYCFYNNNYHKDESHWTDTDGNILKRYNPVTRKAKSEYGAKPWNRK